MPIKFDMNQCVSAQLAASGYKFDAGETAAFSRELEAIQAEAIEIVYPEFTFDKLVPIKSDGGQNGETTHTYREVEGFGDAEFLDGMAPEDFPTAEVRGKEITGKFRPLGTKYAYNLEEIKRAALMSIKPEEHRSRLARKVVEGRFDRAVWNGGGGFSGLAQDANSQDDSSLVTADWTTATADQIKDSVQALVNKAFETSNGAFAAFDLAFAPKCWTKLGKRLDTYSDKTVADFLLASVPMLRSLSWTGRLAGVGASGKDRILCYPRDPQVIEAYIPTRFDQMPPQFRGMQFEVYCMAKYGGLRIHHPNVIRRADVTT